jgi:hypothetical protein
MQKQVQQVFEDDWQKIVGLLPAGWEAQARELGALKFGRKIKTPEQLLRLLLQHFCHNDSMRTTVAKGAAGQLADISDVGLLKRINRACKSFCVNATEQISDRIVQCGHRIRS